MHMYIQKIFKDSVFLDGGVDLIFLIKKYNIGRGIIYWVSAPNIVKKSLLNSIFGIVFEIRITRISCDAMAIIFNVK